MKAKSSLYPYIAPLLANVGLVALWLWLYRGVYPYLGIIFTRQEFRTNQIVLAGVLALIYLQVRKGKFRLRLDSPPQLYAPALALALGCSALYLLIERYLDINTFSATLFGLASYGLLGLWMQPQPWRGGLPAILLLAGALPFGEHMQTFIGYPVRVMTAEIVRAGLLRLGVDAVGVDTILVFENGISKVDLPCSGVKSLWTGGLFLLAATWVERRSINLRWMLAGLGFALLLLGANLARVAVLVALGHVAGWRLLAEISHVPLGVLGFVGACGAAVLLLRWAGEPGGEDDAVAQSEAAAPEKPRWLAPVTGVIVLAMALLYTPREQSALAEFDPAWEFPEQLAVEPWPMSAGETAWVSQSGIASATRWRFRWMAPAGAAPLEAARQDPGSISISAEPARLSGSMLFVFSRTWRAHHRPEACLEIYGLSVNRYFTVLAAPDFPVRALVLDSEREKEVTSAVYWLQSAEQVTDDYATRIWADLAPDQQPWVLVTLLFDRPVDPQSEAAQALFRGVRLSVQRHFEGGMQP